MCGAQCYQFALTALACRCSCMAPSAQPKMATTTYKQQKHGNKHCQLCRAMNACLSLGIVGFARAALVRMLNVVLAWQGLPVLSRSILKLAKHGDGNIAGNFRIKLTTGTFSNLWPFDSLSFDADFLSAIQHLHKHGSRTSLPGYRLWSHCWPLAPLLRNHFNMR